MGAVQRPARRAVAERSGPAPAPPAAADPWHALDPAEVEERLGTTSRGLSTAEAAARLDRHGPNTLEEDPPEPRLVVLARQFRSPLIYVLVGAAAVTVLLGEHLDAAVIAAVLAINAAVGFTQERKAETAVRALKTLVVPRCRAMRDGREWELDSARLVPGDVVVVDAGGRVPADLRLSAVSAFRVDESLLTGESVPVTKQVEAVAATAALADRRDMAYTGTVATTGRATGIVVATGSGTELGAIAGLIRTEEAPPTPLQLRMGRFARLVGVAVATAATVAFASGVALGGGVHDMFLVAVAMAVSAVPEGLPVAVTITLAVGVRRMARRHAIIRRLAAVETLGSTTVIGSDKTGTLTENRMTVQAVWTVGHRYRFVGSMATGSFTEGEEPAALATGSALHETLLGGVLTSDAEAYRRGEEVVGTGDPTEVAMLGAAMAVGIEPDDARTAYPLFAEIPFDPARRYAAAVRARDGRHVVVAKGAPERIAAMCRGMLTDGGVVPIDPAVVEAAADALAASGLRVLAVATGDHDGEPHQAPAGDPSGLVLVGLQGMMDPPRPGVRDAVAACREAGIRTVMITGDHAATARAVAARLGIDTSRVLAGPDLDGMGDDELPAAVAGTAVFARVAPEQKLRIVSALQANGEIVAVTGDGVNDAPALKAAQIGVAMGRGGTDVAREAAEMVLADDNFVSITAAVEEGRVTFDNIRKVTFFLVSTGAAEIVAILVAVWLGWPLVFLPAQLLWLNLVTNGLQDIALAFEPGEPGVLRRRPRPPREGILSRTLWERTAVAGVVMAAGTLAMFRWELDRSGSVTAAQTVALTTMVAYQVLQAGNARSETLSVFRLSPWSNPFLLAATAAAVTVHVAALYLPPTQYVLRVEPVDPDAWLRIVLTALSILVAMELHKAWRRRRPAGGGGAERGPGPHGILGR